ncbi:hypothetical protein ScPMuIL_008352 [Solemya velum]
MVRVWFMDGTDADQHLPHQTDPPKYMELADLEKYGILYWKLDADNYEAEGKLKEIRERRNYDYGDEIECSREKLPDYDETMRIFFTEHIHEDEEIRFVTDGSGYFDFRDPDDRWVRMEVVKGDLIILPAGIYHRFTLDTNNYLKALRFFTEVPVWTPYNRPADDHPSRKKYVEWLSTNA